MLSERFHGKTVFITGGASPHGMSFATAQAFVAEGASVFLFDCDAERLPSAAASLAEGGRRIGWHTGDVRVQADVDAALDACERSIGPIDILVNHAGIGPSKHTLEISEADWDLVLGVNLTGIFRVARSVARRMAGSGGVILNMSSSGGIAAEPGHAHYAASKAGILALTRAMAHDLCAHGIRVCAICPGDVDTYEWDNVELARLYRLRIAAGRSGRPEEVSAVYLYLASDDARHLNGVAFVVDGGMLAWE